MKRRRRLHGLPRGALAISEERTPAAAYAARGLGFAPAATRELSRAILAPVRARERDARGFLQVQICCFCQFRPARPSLKAPLAVDVLRNKDGHSCLSKSRAESLAWQYQL